MDFIGSLSKEAFYTIHVLLCLPVILTVAHMNPGFWVTLWSIVSNAPEPDPTPTVEGRNPA